MKIKKHECETCKKRFAKKYNLEVHLKKKFKCINKDKKYINDLEKKNKYVLNDKKHVKSLEKRITDLEKGHKKNIESFEKNIESLEKNIESLENKHEKNIKSLEKKYVNHIESLEEQISEFEKKNMKYFEFLENQINAFNVKTKNASDIVICPSYNKVDMLSVMKKNESYILNSGRCAITRFFELLYFDKKNPQNHTIYAPHFRSKNIAICENNEMVYTIKKGIVVEIFYDIQKFIKNYYDNNKKKHKLTSTISLEKLLEINPNNKSDKKQFQEIMYDFELLLFNNRKMVKTTIKYYLK